VLKTNLSKHQHSIAKVLAKYREQSKVEKRFHHFKGVQLLPQHGFLRCFG